MLMGTTVFFVCLCENITCLPLPLVPGLAQLRSLALLRRFPVAQGVQDCISMC
jgi:hypothetical protein